MRCEAIQQEISARLDGAEDRTLQETVDDHISGCRACATFAEGAERLRVLARLEAAPAVPDLVPRIMARAAPRTRRAWLPLAAAFVAGALAGAVLVGGLPAIRMGPDPALATGIPERIAAAAAHVTAYRATFAITERNFHPDVPIRRLTARVAFVAPERFRAHIRDRTSYPSSAWPRNDLVLEVDRDRWTLRGPAGCPREALPLCAPGALEETLTGREPFDGHAPMPTDIVLPLRSLAGSDRVRVAGHGRVLGRETVEVALAYRDAAPLFAYLHAGGMWRPLFPLDQVHIALDASTWFPLAFRVQASPRPERAAWALRNGLPSEPPGRTVLQVEARALQTGAAALPPAPPARSARDLGFRDAPLTSAVPLPRDVAGLRRYRSGSRDGTAVVTYARGLSWLKVSVSASWGGPEPFGLASGPVETVTLPGGDLAAYQPATATGGRRISIHAPGWDLVLESNLPRSRLAGIAASVPVRGKPLPAGWRTRPLPGGVLRIGVSTEHAQAAFPKLIMPGRLPEGYEVATIDLTETRRVTAVTVRAWRPGTELDGAGIVLHQSSVDVLPPPMEPDVVSVRIRGVVGRYSPTRGELEWIEAGAYRSLRSERLALGEALAVARRLRR